MQKSLDFGTESQQNEINLNQFILFDQMS